MADYDPTEYGARLAGDYDAVYQRLFEADTAGAVDRLVELAGGGAVLELGVGTGRLALPLAARGVPVHGVEASPDMVAQLRAKPGGAALPVSVGNFAETVVPGEFAVVVLAVNTIYALPTQDAQVRCFANAAAHLRPGGRFVVEGWVPDLARFTDGQSVRAGSFSGDGVLLEVARHDPVAQRIETTQVDLTAAGVRLYPANHRYVWPAELDLMARLAGLRLEHRWGGWAGEPFDAQSRSHVSVYRLE